MDVQKKSLEMTSLFMKQSVRLHLLNAVIVEEMYTMKK